MGVVIPFPCWRVETRDEGFAPGDPVVLVHPSGIRHDVARILRRRLIASPDPAEPIRQETHIQTEAGFRFVVRYLRREERWEVEAL